jgi:hypothetical protein
MNQALHQLLQLILQGLAWFLHTIEALWVWSWPHSLRAVSNGWSRRYRTISGSG